MSGKAPKGWILLTLGDIANWSSGGTPSRSKAEYFGGTIPWFKSGDLKTRVVTSPEEFITDIGLKNSSAKILPAGSILIAMYGATIGQVSILGCDAATNQTCAAANPYDGIYPNFLYHYLKSQKAIFIALGIGGAQPNISQTLIKKHPFPLPPLAEQHRIVAKLDSILPRVEKVRERLEKIPALVKRFRQSVLTAAVTGKLTEGWREKNPGAGNEWKTIDLVDFTPDKGVLSWIQIRADQCCQKVQSGGTPKGSQFSVEGGVPFLKVYNIVNQAIDFDYKPQFVSSDIHRSELRKSIAFPGDVLMNIVGPPLGKVAIVPRYHPEWNLNQAITMFRPKEYLDNRFLYFVLREGSSYSEILEETRGSAGQSNISLSQCREMLFRLPPLSEQKEIVRQVDKLFALADKLESHYQRAMARVEKFPQAILAKAFRGELVPQDPNDEPAEKLLERIRQDLEQVVTAPGSPRRHRGRPKRALEKARS